MNTKTTIAVLLVAVALGVYVYFLQSKPPSPGGDGVLTGSAVAGERLFDAKNALNADAVDTLTVTLGDKPPMVFKRVRGENWDQVEPVAFPAEGWTLSRIVGDVIDLRYTSTFDPAEKQITPERLGLAPPHALVEIADADAPNNRMTVAIGSATAGGKAYAVPDYRAGATLATVYVIDAALARQFEGDVPAKLRNRSPIQFDPGEADRATLTNEDGTIKLERREGDWSLTEPVTGRADRAKVNALIGALGSLRIERFAADNPENLADYGLAAPRRALTVRTAPAPPPADLPDAKPAEPRVRTLRIGAAVDPSEMAYYAMLDEAPVVFEVLRPTVDHLAVKPDSLRDPRLTSAMRSDVTALTIKPAKGEAVRLIKDQGVWRFAEGGPAFKLDPETVQSAIDGFFAARATGFASPDVEAIDKAAAAEVELSLIGQGEPRRFTLHAMGEAKDQLAVVPGDEKLAYLVKRAGLEALLAGPGAYRDRTLVSATTDQLARVRIERKGRWPAEYVLERATPAAQGPAADGAADEAQAGDWKLDGFDRAMALAVLRAIAPMQAERWLDEPFEPGADFAVVTLEDTGGNTTTLTVDYATGRGSVEGVATGFEIDRRLATAFEIELRDRQVVNLTVEDVATIQTRDATVNRDAQGRFSLEGDGKLDEASAAAMFDVAATLSAGHYLPTLPTGDPAATLTVKPRTGEAMKIEVWTAEKAEPIARVGDKVFTITPDAAEALTAGVTMK